MTVLVEKEILGFNVSVGDTLGMQILDTLQDLFETTLDFTRAHAAALDRSVEIAARTVLHDFTPVLVLILDEIDGLDDKSELAHRIMLVNLLRLLGAVKIKKASRHFVTRPTQVILPLSPNHGLFGNDGLYSESKISLETLFNRWNSESWGEYLCLAGAVIGYVL